MRDRLQAEIAAALKAQDRSRLSALRLISAALQERELAGTGALSPAETATLLRKMQRQRREAHAHFVRAGRTAQAEQEALELQVIAEFLPSGASEEASEQEVRARVAAAISELGARQLRDLGKVMGLLKARYPGRMDLAAASAIARDILS
jgi:uncharacterized protein YqeY